MSLSVTEIPRLKLILLLCDERAVNACLCVCARVCARCGFLQTMAVIYNASAGFIRELWHGVAAVRVQRVITELQI